MSRIDDKQVAGDHYKKLKITPWEYIDANGLDYYEGNIIKYLARYKYKGGVEDLKKLKHHVDKLIEKMEVANGTANETNER